MCHTESLSSREDLARLKNNHVDGKTRYFLKDPSKHRQKGITQASSVAAVLAATKGNQSAAALAQVALGAPGSLQGHKINLRTYILVACEGGGRKEHPARSRQRWFVHETAGKVYYTPLPYKVLSHCVSH